MSKRMLFTLLATAGIVAAAFYIFRTGMPQHHHGGKRIVDVQVPELSPAARRGEELFNANCASCHGENAVGQEGVAPPLVHIIYEPGHHGDMAFQLAAKNGVRAHHWPFGDMPPVMGVTEDEVTAITRYVRELQRANGIF